jgi:hypothetical protein
MNTAGRFQIVYMRRLLGEESNLAKQPSVINAIFTEAGVRWCGNDWGFGAANNERLIQEMGWNRYGANRLLLEYQYAEMGELAKWKQSAQRYILDRTQAMGRLVDSIRTGKVCFFRSEDFRPFLDDFTTIFVEYSDKRNKIKYDHEMSDDAFHSVLYAFFAMLQFNGQLVRTALPNL